MNNQLVDGILSLSPKEINKESDDINLLFFFVKQMKIEYQMFSIFLSDVEHGSHILFGSYDPKAFDENAEIKIIKTVNSDSWAVDLKTFYLQDQKLGLNYTGKKILFNP